MLQILLVATHLGEFWPFSIYPMFSKGGRTWTRALVRDVEAVSDSLAWQSVSLNQLKGSPVALPDYGLDQVDYANFVYKTRNWDDMRIQGLRDLFKEENLRNKKWLAMIVRGYLNDADSVVALATPLFILTGDSTFKNPNLPEAAYYNLTVK